MDFLNEQLDQLKLQKEYTVDDLFNIFVMDQEDFENGTLQKIVGVDKYYAYCWFVTDFGHTRFFFDYPDIFRAFLEHELTNLRQYNDISYFKYRRGCVPLEDEIYCQCKNLMFCAYKHGSIFAKKYWQNIFKEYFPEQYFFLTRYQSKELHFSDLIRNLKKSKPIDTANSQYFSTVDIGLDSCAYVVMAEIFDIRISDDCDYIYFFSEVHMKEMIKKGEEAIPEREIDQEKLKNASDYANKIIKEKGERYPFPENWYSLRKRGYSYLRYSQRIEDEALYLTGYGSGWIHGCFRDSELPPEETLRSTLIVTKYIWPDKEFSFEEIQSWAALFNAVSSFTRTATSMFWILDTMLGFMPQLIDDGELDRPKESTFKGKIVPKIENNSLGSEVVVNKNTSQNIVLDKANDVQNEDAESIISLLQGQIERLQLEKHKLESSYDYLKSLYREKNSLNEQLDSLSAKYDVEHQELIELRNHLYQMTETDYENEKYDMDSIKEVLKKYNIVIIGGHTNWVQKVKELFPKWKYVDIKASASDDTKIIDKCDKVYFYTDCLSHATYYRYIGLLRTRLIPFGYIHSVNINAMLLQMADELNIEKNK